MRKSPIIRRATDEDILTVCRGLRQGDIDEAMALYGVHPAFAIPLHHIPEETWACEGVTGPPGAHSLCGTAPTDLEGVGQIWMISLPFLTENKLPFLRFAPKVIEMFHEKYPILWNYIDARQKTHLQWLKFSGFQVIDYKPRWGVAGLPFYEVVKTRGGSYPAARALKKEN